MTFARLAWMTTTDHRHVLLTLAALVGSAAATRAAEIPTQGSTAPDFELQSLAGDPVKLSSITAKGPVVLVVLRGYPGYQCPVCSAQVAELAQKSKLLAEAGASVLLVYPGPAERLKSRAEEFVAGKALPENFTLLLDPDYRFTSAYSLRWDAPGETAYPSTFVLDGTRRVLFAKVSRTHGGRANAGEVLRSLSASPQPAGRD